MSNKAQFRNTCISSIFIVVGLVGCGGGSGGSEAHIEKPPVNVSPVVHINSSIASTTENSLITLTATASDSDGSIESILWQSSNGSLVSPTNLVTTFEAPSYEVDNAEVTITLTVTDDDGAESTETLTFAIRPRLEVTGSISYDYVEVTAQGYDYENISQKPIRGASINLLDTSGSIIASTNSDESGEYTLELPNVGKYGVEVVSELGNDQTKPNYISVRDNFTASDEFREPELTSAYRYTILPIQTISEPLTNIDYNAELQWDSSLNSYRAGRAAPVFALLDQAFDMKSLLKSWSLDYAFEPLYIFWNENNVAVNGVWWNGEIANSSFAGHNMNSLFVASDSEVNIDEYDRTVIAHELGHYVLVNLTRDESIGGTHSMQSAMDQRQSFAEGFSSYFAWLLTGSEVLIDSDGLFNGITNVANIFDNPIDDFDMGWFYENVNADILKNITSGNDSFGLTENGYSFVFDVLEKEMKSSDALISIHSFLGNAIKREPDLQSSLSAFVNSKGINSVDEWGSGESYSVAEHLTINNLNHTYLPLYRDMEIDVPQTVCLNDVVSGTGNRLGVFAYLKLNVVESGDYLVEWSSNEGPSSISSHNHLGPRFLFGGGLHDNVESDLYGSRVIDRVPAELNVIRVSFYGNEFPNADTRAPYVKSGCITLSISKI